MAKRQSAEAVRQEYDRLAGDYDRRWRPYIDATLQAVVSSLEFDGPAAILDVPCGTGELERRLLTKWPALRITGADLSPGMLEQARAKDAGNRVTWIESDVAPTFRSRMRRSTRSSVPTAFITFVTRIVRSNNCAASCVRAAV